MNIYEEMAREFAETLALESSLVAVRYQDQPHPVGDSERKLSPCEAIDAARREDVILNLSADNCSCPGGKHYLGLESMPEQTLLKVLTDVHKIFASDDLAKDFMQHAPSPPLGRGKYVLIAPLPKMDLDPDLVLALCNAEQAGRIVSLAMYSGLRPFPYYLVGAGCTSLANALVTDDIDINFITEHARRRVRDFATNELIISMPYHRFKSALANIPFSGSGKGKQQS